MLLQQQVADLTDSNQELRGEVDRLTRHSKRQAPRPEEITEPPVNVPVALEPCPSCGEKLAEERVDFAYVTDLPQLPRPRVTQYRVWVCRCTGGGRKVRGAHPDLAPDQYGATAHRLGPRAMATAHALHYQVGIPVRKVPLVLGLLTGMELTQGAITQDALRRARGQVGQKYQELRAGVRN